jgi:tetratricopeptide (TPR) repeat protein
MRVRGCVGALVLLVPLVLWCSGAARASGAAGATGAAGAAGAQQPVFRTSADLVTVPVSVRASGTPVAGLKPEDFLVLDNGVPQKITSVEGEAVPADITIVVETSLAMKDYIGSISDQVKRIAAMLRPTDRLEVLGVDTYVEPLLSLKPAAEQPPIGRLRVGGLASINDAMVAALLREPDRERPHLVIVISDTIDSMSTTEMTTVRDVAKQSGATLVIAWVTLSLTDGPPPPPWYTSAEREGKAVTAPISGGKGPTIGNGRSVDRSRYWIPHYSPPPGRPLAAFDPLSQAAEESGGALHPPGVFTDRSAAAIFKKVFDDYRHSYVIRYNAEGVARDGWHEIVVTTPRTPSYELHARKGYLVEAPPRVNRASATPGSLLALYDAEAADDEAGVEKAIRWNRSSRDAMQLLSDFKAGVHAFPGEPRREFVLALQLAESTLPMPYTNVRASTYDLLARYSRLVRQVSGDDEFEKDWMAAALALSEAPVRPADAQKLLESAIKRFPDEPRFLLAKAMLADQQAQAKTADAVIGFYDAATMSEFTRDEARVRKARLLNRLGRNAEALANVDAVTAIQNDQTLQFWRELIRAKILDDLGRLSDAIAGFRAALAIAPEAQSARMGLMTSLARNGQTADALVVAEAIQTAGADADDPWWRYWQADYRFFPNLLARMKGLAK